MDNDLIKRIDNMVSVFKIYSDERGIASILFADCLAEIERLSKPYVPMTDDEISQMMQDWYNDTSDETSLSRFIEAAVIKRLGLEIKHG